MRRWLFQSILTIGCGLLCACGGDGSSTPQAGPPSSASTPVQAAAPAPPPPAPPVSAAPSNFDCTSTAAPGSGLKLAVIGDSITEGLSYGGVKTYHAVLGERLKFDKVINYGVGGSAYAKVPPNSSLAEIADRATTDADVIIVFGGINDLLNPVGKVDDSDPSTVHGGLNILFSGLKNKFPRGAIGIIVPLGYNSGPERKDARLTTVLNIIEDGAKLYQLPYFNLFEHTPFDPYDAADREKFMPDGLHPNTEGHALIANVLEPFVRDLALSVRKARCG